jgi:hypothetical protein
MRDTQTPDAGPGAGPGSSWPLVLPLTLLVILGLAGLRGAVTAPRWNGPLRRDGPGIGLALEVILGVLLVLTYRRRSRAMRAPLLGGVPVNDVAAKLRGATHLAESDASPEALRPQVRVLAVGAGLLALGAGAGMLPATGPGAGSALLRLIAAGALIAAAALVLPFVAPPSPRN